MIRATTLRGRSVVDLDAATKLGQIEELILDLEGRHVAGLVVTQGQALLGERHERVLPASLVNAIGPDAVTVHGGQDQDVVDDRLDGLPWLSAIIGRKVVSHDGRLLGVIGDVLIAPEDGSIMGYALGGHHPAGRLEELFGGAHETNGGYVRADAELRVGPDLIVVPDDAVVTDGELDDQAGPAPNAAPAASPVRWRRPTAAAQPNDWSPAGRADNAGAPATATADLGSDVHTLRTRSVVVDPETDLVGGERSL